MYVCNPVCGLKQCVTSVLESVQGAGAFHRSETGLFERAFNIFFWILFCFNSIVEVTYNTHLQIATHIYI